MNDNNDNAVYTITSRMNHAQKEQLQNFSRKMGVSISAAVKILVNIGLSSIGTISNVQ